MFEWAINVSVALASAGCLAACSRPYAPAEKATTEAPPSRAIPVETTAPTAPSGPPLVHATGLTLGAQPGEYRVRETEVGFRIDPVNARRMRSAWSIELQLSAKEPAGGGELRAKAVANREAHYRVTDDGGGGSGGPLYTLTAWIACGAGNPNIIVISASQQAEPPSTPDWSIAWTILAASRCAPKP